MKVGSTGNRQRRHSEAFAIFEPGLERWSCSNAPHMVLHAAGLHLGAREALVIQNRESTDPKIADVTYGSFYRKTLTAARACGQLAADAGGSAWEICKRLHAVRCRKRVDVVRHKENDKRDQ
jgi:hypothetical protein